jgi:pimeloyl-ACP methyl ester carboxylesterase
LTSFGAGPKKQTVVVGGSYPGALSAWFRVRYPQIAIASWSSSGVVEPIVDFWPFDNQVYLSSVKSGSACPTAIQKTVQYVTHQGVLRDSGDQNTVID